jgi:hypothetical protein
MHKDGAFHNAASTMPIKHYRTIREKKRIVKAIQEARGHKSLNELCREYKIQPKQFRCWLAAMDEFQAAPDTKKKTLHAGHAGAYVGMEEELQKFLTEMDGLVPITVDLVVKKAGLLKPDLTTKPKKWQERYARLFLHKIKYTTKPNEKRRKDTQPVVVTDTTPAAVRPFLQDYQNTHQVQRIRQWYPKRTSSPRRKKPRLSEVTVTEEASVEGSNE